MRACRFKKDLPISVPRAQVTFKSRIPGDQIMFKQKPNGSLAVLNISGRISDATALAVFMALRNVEWKKRGIAGLLLRICSEGGSLAAAQAICEGIDILREETGLVVVSAVEDMALSAAFYLAVGVDYVFASPAATVGAVGAIVGTYDLNQIEQRLGIDYRITRSAPLKGYLSLHGVSSDTGQASLQSLVDDVHEQFVDWIVERRGLPGIAAEAVDGRMLSGRQARALGLIDAVGGTAAAITYLSLTTNIQQPALIFIEVPLPGSGVLRGLVERLPFGGLLAWLFKLRG